MKLVHKLILLCLLLKSISAARRYEAATWLRKMGAAELPETPSEEEFKFFLKNGIVLCNVLNKIHPGAVSQVISTMLLLYFFKVLIHVPGRHQNTVYTPQDDKYLINVHQKQVNHPPYPSSQFSSYIIYTLSRYM